MKKDRPAAQTDRGKGKARAASGHWVMMHEPDGSYRHVFIKGPRPAGGKPARPPFRSKAVDAARRADFISGGSVTGRDRGTESLIRKAHKLREAREAHNERVKVERSGKAVAGQVKGAQGAFRDRLAARTAPKAAPAVDPDRRERAAYRAASETREQKFARLRANVAARNAPPAPKPARKPGDPGYVTPKRGTRAQFRRPEPGTPGHAAYVREARADREAARAARANRRAGRGDESLASFAGRVKDAAAGVPAGERFGDSKVFLSDAYRRYAAAGGSLGPAAFKRRLAEANRAGHLSLSRADLVEAMDPRKVRTSQHKDFGSEFHFLRGVAPAPARPSLREQVERHRAGKGTRAERLTALGAKMQRKFEAAAKKRADLERGSASMNTARLAAEGRADNSNPGERRAAKADAALYRQRAYELGEKAGRYRRHMNRLESRGPVIGNAIRAEKGAILPGQVKRKKAKKG